MPKVTGKRGIQVWVPIKPMYSFEDERQWVEALSRAIGATVPKLVSWQWEKSSRRGLARLDYTQNAVNKTLVAPYAVRPVADAPVGAHHLGGAGRSGSLARTAGTSNRSWAAWRSAAICSSRCSSSSRSCLI